MISKSGEILVGTEDGLNKYDKENDNFVRIYNDLSSQQIYSISEDLYGDYWIGTKNGLNKINNSKKQIEKYFSSEKDKNTISDNFIYTLQADNLGYLWIGTYNGGLNKLNIKTGNVQRYSDNRENSIPGRFVRDIIRDSRGYIWVATNSGFAKLNEDDNTFVTYSYKKDYKGGMLSNDILSIYEDIIGNIWIGTVEGINLFNPENVFKYYTHDSYNENSLSGKMISGIYEDNDGSLWVGTIYTGLNIVDTNKVITRIDSRIDYDGELVISNNFIRDIVGKDNEIFIGTEKGLNKYDKNTKRMTVYSKKDGLNSEDITSLTIDKDGLLWIGTTDGIYTLDKQNNLNDYSDLFKSEGINKLNIYDIHEDKYGTIWIALDLEYGLVSFNKDTKEIEAFSNIHLKNKVNKKPYYTIMCMESDEQNNLWIGTDKGLVKLNLKTQTYVIYDEKNGLPNNFIYGILFENNEELWVSTNYGISKLNTKTRKFTNYDSFDGLQGNEFNPYSYFKSNNGHMYFGGTNGLTSFDPSNIKEKAFKFDIRIENINTNLGSINLDNEIELSYKTNLLHFEFFMPEYSGNRKIKYKYKLEGIDDDWIESEIVNNVSYSNIKPGNYTFKVMARSSSGEWSKQKAIDIKVNSPIWKTPFAYIIYIVFISFCIYVIWNRVKILDTLVKQKTLQLNHKLEENEQLYSKLLKQEKYKNNYFINLSHELRTPLNIISSTQSLISHFNESDKEISKDKMSYYMGTIKRNCLRLRNLIDNILDNSKIESGSYKINIKENDIVYLVEEVALSMKELAEEKEIELIIEPYIEEKIIECDEMEIERVIINLISNAIKFTHNGGKIEVYIWDLDNFVKIVVKDNGIGISPKNHKAIFDRFSQAYSETSEEFEGSGLGLTLSKQLIELHEGSIGVKSELGKGSEFTILLPVGKKYI